MIELKKFINEYGEGAARKVVISAWGSNTYAVIVGIISSILLILNIVVGLALLPMVTPVEAATIAFMMTLHIPIIVILVIDLITMLRVYMWIRNNNS